MSSEARKRQHLEICLSQDVSFHSVTTGLERIRLPHSALPEVSADEVDLRTELLGKSLSAPLMIAAMTGGTPEAGRINRNLARAAQELGIAMGLGSQRPMLEDPGVAPTFQVRDVAPDILLLGNLGIGQLVEFPAPSSVVARLVYEVGADGLCVHFGPAHELCQVDGERDFRKGLEVLSRACGELNLPVVAKETGCGIAGNVAVRLEQAGVAAIDVGGAGGTSWCAVEAYRGSDTAETFRDWGLPLRECLEQCVGAVSVPLIATGGVRTGLDVAKCLGLGGRVCGMALPLLKPATQSAEAVMGVLRRVIAELRAAMVLCEARTADELRRVVGGCGRGASP